LACAVAVARYGEVACVGGCDDLSVVPREVFDGGWVGCAKVPARD